MSMAYQPYVSPTHVHPIAAATTAAFVQSIAAASAGTPTGTLNLNGECNGNNHTIGTCGGLADTFAGIAMGSHSHTPTTASAVTAIPAVTGTPS